MLHKFFQSARFYCFVLVACLAFVLMGQLACNAVTASGTLVRFSGVHINMSDFEDKLDQYNMSMKDLKNKDNAALKQMILHELIEEEAMLLEAKKQNLSVSKEELKKAKSTWFNAEDAKEDKIFAGKHKDKKLERFLILQKMQNHIAQASLDITDDAMRAYYEKNQNSFVKKKQYQIEMIESKHEQDITQAYQKISEENFTALNFNWDILDLNYMPAKWMAEDLIPKKLANYLQQAKVKSISSIIKSEHAYYVVRLHGVKLAHIPNYYQVENDIRKRMKQEHKHQALMQWKQDFFARTKIERNEALLAKI